MKNFLHNWNLLCSNLCPLPPVLLLCTLKSSSSTFSLPYHYVMEGSDASPISLHFLRLSKASAVICSSYSMNFIPLTFLVTLFWIYCGFVSTFLVLEIQIPHTVLWMGVSQVLNKGESLPLHCWTHFLLIQPEMLLDLFHTAD